MKRQVLNYKKDLVRRIGFEVVDANDQIKIKIEKDLARLTFRSFISISKCQTVDHWGYCWVGSESKWLTPMTNLE